MKYLITFSFLLVFACGNINPENGDSRDAQTIIYLVRHAEKDTGSNPPLTTEGQARAEALAEFLDGKGITEIFSTDYLRTQQTAAPVAQKFNRGVGSYHPNQLKDLANRIRKNKGTILVVGHSNTTPELAEIFGADPGEPIAETWEYDRIYELKLNKGKLESGKILRFGEASRPQ